MSRVYKTTLVLGVLFILVSTAFQMEISDDATGESPIGGTDLELYASFDDCSTSTLVVDDSGNGNTGTVPTISPSNPEYVGTTKFGRAMNFDGVDDYVDFGVITALSGADEFTIEMWFFRTEDETDVSVNGVYNVLLSQTSYATNSVDNLEIGTNGESVQVYMDTLRGSALNSVDCDIYNDKWYHIAYTYEGWFDSSSRTFVGEATLYIDGILKKTWDSTAGWGGDLTSSTPIPFVCLGVTEMDHITNPRGDYCGIIDEVKIFTTVLTPADGIGNCVLQYGFEEGIGPNVYDHSGQGNDGMFYPKPTLMSGCESTTDWTGTTLSVDTTDKIEATGSIKDTVSTIAALTEYITTYDPTGSWDLEDDNRLQFWLKSDWDSSEFTHARLYIKDTYTNWLYWNLSFNSGIWTKFECHLTFADGRGSVFPDLSSIDKLEFNFKTIGAAAGSIYKKIDLIRYASSPLTNTICDPSDWSGTYISIDTVNNQEGTGCIEDYVGHPRYNAWYPTTRSGSWDMSTYTSLDFDFYHNLVFSPVNSIIKFIRMFIFDNLGNYRYWNLAPTALTWVPNSCTLSTGNGQSATPPALTSIKRIEFNIALKNEVGSPAPTLPTNFFKEIDDVRMVTSPPGTQIDNCDSFVWSIWTGNTFSMSFVDKRAGGGSLIDTDSNPTNPSWCNSVYIPAISIDMTDHHRLLTWLKCDRASTAFNNAQVYLHESTNYMYWDVAFDARAWELLNLDLSNPDGSSGNTDLSKIDKISYKFQTKDTTGFYKQLDYIGLESMEYSTGVYGGDCMAFDGDNDGIYVDDSSSLDLNGPFTIEAWIKTDDSTSTMAIVDKYDSSSKSGYSLYVKNSNIVVEYWYGQSTSIYAEGIVDIADGEWHHVGGVLAGDYIHVYVDGISDVKVTLTYVAPTTNDLPLTIGIRGLDDTRQFDGLIDDVRIYNFVKPIGAEMLMMPFDEGAGTTTDDDSVYQNDGVLYNNAAFTTSGKYGYGIDFDGVNDYVLVDDDLSLDLTGPFTIEAWVYANSVTNQRAIVDKYSNSGSTTGYSLSLNSGKVRLEIWSFFGSANVESTNAILTGEWNHVAGTFDDDSLRVYINGVLEGTISTALNPGTNDQDLAIGIRKIDYTRDFHGIIDNVIISNNAKTFNEDIDGDGMTDEYEIIRSPHSDQYNSIEYNGRHAVLVAPMPHINTMYDTYWNDPKFIFDIFKSYGYVDSDIHLIHDVGNDGTNNGYTIEGPRYVDGPATPLEFELTCTKISFRVSSSDYLFVFTFDHGGVNVPLQKSSLYMNDGYGRSEYIVDDEFAGAQYIGRISNYKYRTFFLAQCYSGGFLNDLNNLDTVTTSACRIMEISKDTDGKVIGGGVGSGAAIDEIKDENHEFGFYWMSAFGQRTPPNKFHHDADMPTGAPLSKLISVNEAFQNALAKDSWTNSEKPQIDDDGDGFSEQDPLPNKDPGDGNTIADKLYL